MKEKQTLYSLLALVQILFGINFVVSKIIVKTLPPTLWAEIRFLLSGLILFFVLKLFKQPNPKIKKKDLITIFFFSLIGFTTGQTLLLEGIRLSTASHAAILSSTIPLFSLFISILRKSEKLTWNKGLGFLLSLIGILILQNFEQVRFNTNELLGDFLILLSCFGVGAFLSLGKNFVEKIGPLWATTYFFLMSALQLVPWAIYELSSLPLIHFEPILIYSTLYSIFAATIIAYLLSNWILSKLHSSHVALFTYLQPITAIFLASFALEETLTIQTFLGTLVVFSGFFLTLKKSE